jgi:hypothetical protein
MADPLLVHLANKVEGEFRVMADDLGKGTAKDFGDYKYACGIMRGLLITKGLIMELAERMESDND